MNTPVKLFSILVICVASACSKSSEKPAASSEVVATFGGESLSVHDVEARIAQQPEYLRTRYSTVERRRELVDSMIREKLLLAEAQRQNLQNDPEVKATLERVMVQKLMAKELASAEMNEADMRAWYDAHQSEFVRPERVRVSTVQWLPGADAKRRAAAARERILTLKPELQAAAFTQLAQSESTDETSRVAGGDLGFRTREELTSQLGQPATDAIFKLQSTGEVSAVLESPKGVHLFRLAGRQAGESVQFDEAKARIAQRAGAESRGRLLDQLVERLRTASKVQIDDAVLAKAQVTPHPGPLVP